jgi:hypothetical protein
VTSSRVLVGLGAASVLWVVAAMRWRAALPPVRLSTSSIPSLQRAPTNPSDSALAESAATLVDNDPFRVANEPAAVRYDARAEGSGSANAGSVTAPAPPPRPDFLLRAIVGGPPWQAIVDGFPGRPAGTIVQKGSVIDRITVTAVNRDSVLLRGPDTAWVLTFRRRQ